jgi:hypothetical protein
LIDPHWQVVDLDPVTWRNLGPFFEPRQYVAAAQPGEHGLFILHERGRVLKVVDTQSRSAPDGIPPKISDPHALAEELYQRGEWQRVHIIDRRHLAWVAQQAQATSRRNLTMDAYYHLVYTLMWEEGDGYVSEPPHPGNFHGWTYEDIRRFVEEAPSPSSFALGVYAGDALSIGLILVSEGGQITKVTTFEGLDWDASQTGPTAQTLSALSEALEARFAPPAAILLCTDAAFHGWLDASDKLAYLTTAEATGDAIWRVGETTKLGG